MKKAIYVIGVVIVIILAVVCYIFSTKENGNEDVILNIQELATKIQEQDVFDDTLEQIDKETIIKNYGFTEEEIVDAVAYVSTGATSEEILVVETNNVNSVKTKIDTRISDRAEAFASYLPDEVYKLENPTLIIQNNYIILCVCKDSAKMNEYVENYIKDIREA